MKLKNKILAIFITIFVVSASGLPLLFAQTISVSDNNAVVQMANGDTFIIMSTSDALDQVVVNTAATNFTVTTALVSGSVKIKSAKGVNIGKRSDGINYYNDNNIALSTCDTTGSNGSVLTITANTTSVITVIVTPPAQTAGDYICTASSTATVTTSYSGGVGGTSPVSTPTPTVTKVTKPEVKQPKKEEAAEITFKDVSGAKEKYITPVVEAMLACETYKMPANSEFSVNKKLNRSFAASLAVTVSGKICDKYKKYPGSKKINEQVISEGLMTSKQIAKKDNVRRLEFYEILLKALGVNKVETLPENFQSACTDTKLTTKTAKIFYTAKNLGFAPVYKGGKCKLNQFIPRYEAAKITDRALKVK